MRLQKLDPTAVHGITEFSDLTDSEFSRQFLDLNDEIDLPNDVKEAPILNTSYLPSEFDWCYQGAVTMGKFCRSSWAFSAIGALEGPHFLANNELVDLSVQQLMDCDRGCRRTPRTLICDHGCRGGNRFLALRYANRIGIASDEVYLYTASDGGTCQFDKSQMVVSVSSVRVIRPNVLQYAANLVNYGPLSLSINAAFMKTYRSGISCPAYCSRRLINLGVVYVGYGRHDVNSRHWIIKNSWGVDWEEDGYYRRCWRGKKCRRYVNPCATIVTATTMYR